MIPEIGQFALILALSLAICQTVIPLVGAHRGDAAMMGVGAPRRPDSSCSWPLPLRA